MNASSRKAKVLSCPLLACDDLIYIHPDGEKLVYGDTLVVSEGYSARFCAGGETYWFRDPQRYTIGYDDRTEEEILRANLMGEDLEGLPLQVNTSVVFCRLKPMNGRLLETEKYLMINRMIGIKPTFRLNLTVIDDEQLLRSISLEARAIDQVSEAINRLIAEHLQESVYPLFNDYSSPEDVRLQLNDPQWASEFLTELRTSIPCSDFGIRIDALEVQNWNVWSGFCEECGAPVQPRDYFCPNRHKIHRCPVCREPIYGGLCLAHGHDILFCPICCKYVAAKDGHCRTHPEIKRNI